MSPALLSGPATTCHGCKRSISLCPTPAGSSVLLDVVERENGDYIVVEQEPGQPPLVRRLLREDYLDDGQIAPALAVRARFVEHDTICPKAKRPTPRAPEPVDDRPKPTGGCYICNEPIPAGALVYEQVTGWAKRRGQGGTNALALRTPTGLVACSTCILSLTSGVDPRTQQTLPG